MTPVVTAAQMRALDAETIEGVGVPGAALMETAGRAVALYLFELQRSGVIDLTPGLTAGLSPARAPGPGGASRVVIVAGPGNNGGDGAVLGRCLHGAGCAARLLLCAARERVRGDALLHLRAAEALGLPVQVCDGPEGAEACARELRALGPRDVIVDALLGTGLSKAASGPLATVIRAMNQSAALRVAVDLPSGLDADRGEPEAGEGAEASAEPPAIVRADHTVTFAFPKLGLVTAPGFTYAGIVSVADIGIPAALCGRHGVRAQLLDAGCLQPALQPRPPLGHKGTHGHLLVVAGSPGKTGAALLCANAAQAVGVGLCTIASPPPAQAALQGRVLEAMTAAYELVEGPGDAAAMGDAAAVGGDAASMGGAAAQNGLTNAQLAELARGKRALAIGPGIPTSAAMHRALRALLEGGAEAAVLDADALNLLSAEPAWLRDLQRPLVLTPHPGEAARLLRRDTSAVQADRVGAARALARLTGSVVVLKGARTLVAAPPPSEDGDGPLCICPVGSAAMGTGGMGDVLTGIIGALLCRGLPAFSAACAAVYWHGLAGDRLAQRRQPGSLVLGGDVIAELPEALAAAAAEPPPPALALLRRL